MFSSQEPQMTPVPSNLIPLCCKPTQQCAYPNSCSHFPALVATCWTQAQAPSPEKPSHLTLPRALKLPQPPDILTKFGTLFLRTCTPSWAMPWVLPLPRSVLAPGMCCWVWGRQGQECPAQLHWKCSGHFRRTAFGPCCGAGQHQLPVPAGFILGLQANSPNQGKTGDVGNLTKNEDIMKKPQPPLHLERDRIRGNSCSHAPIGLGMAKPSKSMSTMNIQISGCFGSQSLSSHSRNRIFYHLTKAKKEVFVPGSVGKQTYR